MNFVTIVFISVKTCSCTLRALRLLLDLSKRGRVTTERSRVSNETTRNRWRLSEWCEWKMSNGEGCGGTGRPQVLFGVERAILAPMSYTHFFFRLYPESSPPRLTSGMPSTPEGGPFCPIALRLAMVSAASLRVP